jgi:ketosteroid isomerase-like protein
VTDAPLEVVRAVCESLIVDDRGRFGELLDPEVVQYGTLGGIDQDRVVRGRQAVIDYWDEIVGTWEGITIDVERLIDAGDTVVALWRETARTRHSELEIQSDIAMVFKVREGRIIEARGYMNRDQALEAAGVAGS